MTKDGITEEIKKPGFNVDIFGWDFSRVRAVPPKDDMTEEIKKPNFTGDISRWDFSPAANMDWVFDKVVPYVFTTDIPKLYLEGISSSPPKEVTGVQSNQARDMVTSKIESLRQAQESSGSKLTKAARKIG